ncbi:MAG: 30S ribosomal protein S20 [Puniceicoccales bacterium]|jgi:small subunit ribosomal protein S20|nr:30S ribosomal protein S20 [Puniceicoccales bacterium]
MANKKSSLKSIRQTIKREEHNRNIKSRLRTQYKKVKVLEKEKGNELGEVARTYISMLDKAVKVGVIHANKASRHKSVMAKFVF